MGQSEQLDQLAIALSEFQKKLKQPKRDSTAKIPTKSGGEYSYRYASLDAVWEAVKEGDLLANCGFCIIQTSGYAISEGESIDTLETMLLHKSGQYKTGEQVLRSKQLDSQGMGSAMTYAKRYGMCAILGIVPAEDDDGAGASAQQRESRQSDLPPCPRCKKELRKDRNDGHVYCWKAKGGCGWDSIKDGDADHETDEETGEIRAGVSEPVKKSQPVLAGNASRDSSKTVPVTAADTLNMVDYDDMVSLAEGNDWPPKFVELEFQRVRKNGASNVAAIARCREKFSQKNLNAIKE